MLVTARQMIDTARDRFQRSKLLRSGSWYMFSTFAERGLAFLGVMLFTRLLTETEYGTVVLFGSWMAMLYPFITLNVGASVQVARYEFGDDGETGETSDRYRDYLASVTGLGLLGGGVALIAALLLPANLLVELTNLEKTLVVLLVAAGVAQVPLRVMLDVWRVEFRYVRYVAAATGYALLRLVLPALLVIWPFLPFEPPLRHITGLLLATAILGLYAARHVFAGSQRLVDMGAWRFALTYAVPLIPHMLTGIILSHFDRVLIDRFVGRSETGLYTLAYQIGELVYMIWYASNTAWVPWFFEQMAAGNDALIYRRAQQYLFAFTGLVLLTILAAPLLIAVVAPPDYRVAGPVVPVVMAGLFFQLPYSLYSNIEFFRKRTAYISVGTALASVVNVGLNIWLLPRYGYIAAAWTTLIAYVCLFAFHAIIVRVVMKEPLRLPFRWLVVCSVTVVLAAVGMVALLGGM